MLPTIKQYRKWSLPAKYSFWGLFLSFIPLTLALRDWVIAVPDYAVLAYNYGTSEMTIYGAAGDSSEAAVIIRGANSHEAGVSAEYYWLQRRYPGYKKISRKVVENSEPGSSPRPTKIRDPVSGAEVDMVMPTKLPSRVYDLHKMRNWYGHTIEVYFDITTFIEKSAEPRPGGINMDEASDLSRERFLEAVKRKMEEKRSKAEK